MADTWEERREGGYEEEEEEKEEVERMPKRQKIFILVLVNSLLYFCRNKLIHICAAMQNSGRGGVSYEGKHSLQSFTSIIHLFNDTLMTVTSNTSKDR